MVRVKRSFYILLHPFTTLKNFEISFQLAVLFWWSGSYLEWSDVRLSAMRIEFWVMRREGGTMKRQRITSEYVHIHDMYVNICEYICEYIYIYVNICEYTWLYVNICQHIYIHIHTLSCGNTKKTRNRIILHVGSCWWRVRRAYDELGKDRLASAAGFLS